MIETYLRHTHPSFVLALAIAAGAGCSSSSPTAESLADAGHRDSATTASSSGRDSGASGRLPDASGLAPDAAHAIEAGHVTPDASHLAEAGHLTPDASHLEEAGHLMPDASHLEDAGHQTPDASRPDAHDATPGSDAPPPGPFTSAFPVGSLTECTGAVWVKQSESFGYPTLTLSESGGRISAELGDGDPYFGTGTLEFDVVNATTALAASGQTFVEAVTDAGSQPLTAGALVLVNGTLVMSLLAADGHAAIVECELPYASCPELPAAPTATLPSGTYGNCLGTESAGTLTLTRTGGAVVADFAGGLLGATNFAPDGGAVASASFTVVDEGVAAIAPANPGVPAVCGGGAERASLVVAGDTLFLAGGATYWGATGVICTATGGTGSVPVAAEIDASVPDSAALAATEQGRDVSDCTQCGSSEICIEDTFQGDECFELGDGGTCQPGTTYDSGANCCVVDPTVTTTCWPTPASCAHGVSCDCASVILEFAGCGDGYACSSAGNVISCSTYSG